MFTYLKSKLDSLVLYYLENYTEAGFIQKVWNSALVNYNINQTQPKIFGQQLSDEGFYRSVLLTADNKNSDWKENPIIEISNLSSDWKKGSKSSKDKLLAPIAGFDEFLRPHGRKLAFLDDKTIIAPLNDNESTSIVKARLVADMLLMLSHFKAGEVNAKILGFNSEPLTLTEKNFEKSKFICLATETAEKELVILQLADENLTLTCVGDQLYLSKIKKRH